MSDEGSSVNPTIYVDYILVDGVTPALSSITTSLFAANKNIQSGAESATTQVSASFGQMIKNINSDLAGVAGNIVNPFTSSASTIKSSFSTISNEAKSSISGLKSWISTQASDFATPWKTAFSGITGPLNTAVTAVKTGLSGLGSIASTAASGIRTAFSGIASVVTTVASKIGSAFTSAMSSAVSVVKSAVTTIKSTISTISSTCQAVGQKMTMYLTLPLAYFAKTALTSYQTFDDSMRQVQAATGATGEQFQSLTKYAEASGTAMGYTATQTADAMVTAAQAGVQVEEMTTAMPAIMGLARAGNTDLTTSTNTLIAVIDTYKPKMSDMQHISDIISEGANESTATISDFTSSLKYAAQEASPLGISIEQTTAMLEEFADAGIRGSTAGTELRQALTNTIVPTKRVTTALTEMGLKQSDIDVKSKGLATVIDNLASKHMNLAQAQMIFGTRAGAGMYEIVQKGSKVLEENTKKLQDNTGYTKKLTDEMNSGWGGAVRTFTANFELLKIKVGNVITQIGTPFVSAINNVIVAFNNATPTTQSLITKIGLLATVTGPLLIGIHLLLSPIGLVSIAVAALGGALFVIDQKTGAVTRAFNSFRNAIPAIINNVKQFAGEVISSFSSMVAGIVDFNRRTGVITTIWNDLKGAAISIFKGVAGAFLVASKAFEAFARSVATPQNILTAWNTIKEVAGILASGIKAAFGIAIASWNFFTTHIANSSNITAAFNTIYNAAVVLGGVLSGVWKLATSAWDKFRSTVATDKNITSTWNAIKNAAIIAGSIIYVAWTTASKAWNAFNSSGAAKSTLTTVWRALAGTAGFLRDTVVGLAGALRPLIPAFGAIAVAAYLVFKGIYNIVTQSSLIQQIGNTVKTVINSIVAIVKAAAPVLATIIKVAVGVFVAIGAAVYFVLTKTNLINNTFLLLNTGITGVTTIVVKAFGYIVSAGNHLSATAQMWYSHASTLGSLVVDIAKVTAESVIKFVTWLVNGMNSAWKVAVSAYNSFKAAVSSVTAQIGAVIIGLYNSYVVPTINAIGKGWVTAYNMFVAFGQSTNTTTNAIGQVIVGLYNLFVMPTVNAMGTAWGVALAVFQSFKDGVWTLISDIGGFFSWLYNSAALPVVNYLGGLWDQATAALATFKNNVYSLFGGIAQDIYGYVQDIVGYINNIIDAVNSVGSIVGKTIDHISSTIGAASQAASSASTGSSASNTAQALSLGAASAGTNSTIANQVASAISAASNSGITSSGLSSSDASAISGSGTSDTGSTGTSDSSGYTPSTTSADTTSSKKKKSSGSSSTADDIKKTVETVKNADGTITKTITATNKTVKNGATDTIKTITKTITDAYGNVISSTKEATNDYVKNGVETITTVNTAAQKQANETVETTKDASGNITKVTTDTVTTVKNGISDIVKTITTNIYKCIW